MCEQIQINRGIDLQIYRSTDQQTNQQINRYFFQAKEDCDQPNIQNNLYTLVQICNTTDPLEILAPAGAGALRSQKLWPLSIFP